MLPRVVPRLVSGHKVGLRGDGELLADYCLRTLPPFFRNLHGLIFGTTDAHIRGGTREPT